jgi:hypothetical protein
MTDVEKCSVYFIQFVCEDAAVIVWPETRHMLIANKGMASLSINQ